MKKEMTLKQFVGRFKNGGFEDSNLQIQCEAGWHDWFCSDKSLARRLKPMGNFLKKIVNSPDFDSEKVYVFFKNNRPLAYSLYDSLSICDIKSGDVLFWVGFNQDHPDVKKYGTTEIARIDRDSEEKPLPVREFVGSRAEAVKWFNSERL